MRTTLPADNYVYGYYDDEILFATPTRKPRLVVRDVNGEVLEEVFDDES